MSARILVGDALDMLRTLDAESVQVCVTSPPYFGLRDYGAPGQMGLEQTPADFISKLVAVFDEVKRVLRPDGLCFVNLGSSYAGSGKGPTGHNGIGNQAKRQGFVGGAGDSGPNRSLSPARAPAYGNDGTARPDYQAPDSACFGLCDECLADWLSHRDRTAGTTLPLPLDAPLPLQTDRDTEPLDSAPVLPDGVALVAQESTTLESWRQLRGECSRCDSRAASFARSGLPIGEHAVPACVRTTDGPCAAHLSSVGTRGQPGSNGYSGETDGASADRTQDRDADSLSYLYSSIAAHQWKPKDLLPIPELFALAMRFSGWIVRSEIIWAKKSAMPESVRDRPTSAWEPIYMFAQQARYFWDAEAVRTNIGVPMEGKASFRTGGAYVNGRGFDNSAPKDWQHDSGVVVNTAGANLRNVWHLGPEPFSDAHFATFPTEIPKRCILAGTSEKGACPACGAPWVRETSKAFQARPGTNPAGRLKGLDESNGWAGFPRGTTSITTAGWAPSCTCPPADPVPCVVIDPFLGSGTTALVADRLGRDSIGIELSPAYAEMARQRIYGDAPMFTNVEVIQGTTRDMMGQHER